MAKLKPSEFRLLLMFAIVAFVLVNVFGYQQLTSRHDAILVQREELITRLKTADIYQKQETESLQKQEWLTKRVPVYGSEDHMKTFLLKFVEQRASSFELVPELQPREPEEQDGYMRSVLEVKISGGIDQLLPFVFSLQDPEEFRSITSFDLKSKPKDPKTLFAEFTIEQWWNLDSPTLVANAEAVPAEMPAGAPSGAGVQPPRPMPVPVPVPDGSEGSEGSDGSDGSDGSGLPAPLQDTAGVVPGVEPTTEADTSQLPVLNESGNEDNPQ